MIKRLLAAWNALTFPLWTAPLALLAAVGLNYALRLPGLGLYWDDWPYLWFFHVSGPAGMYISLGADRPMLGLLYALTLSLVGNSPLAWQIFALVLRWLCALAFWLALCLVWPRQRAQTFTAALLFAIFPGFTQHWISIVWGNAYVIYAAVFGSLALSSWAARAWRHQPVRLAAALALAFILAAFALFSTEYFFGFELLRPVLAWLALAEENLPARARLRRAALVWLPFLALAGSFAAWRLIHPFGGSGSEGLLTPLFRDPLGFVRYLPGRVLQDAFQAFVAGWNGAPSAEPPALIYAALGVLVGLAFWLYLARIPARAALAGWPIAAMLTGVFAFLAAGLPIWLTGLPYTADFPWDRFSLVFAPGVCLALAGLFAWLTPGARRRALLAAVLLALAAGVNNAAAANFRQDWIAAQDLFWQLSWRAPALQPGTLVLIDKIGLQYFEDDTLSAPLNWLYAPNAQAPRLDYHVMNIPERLEGLGYLKPGSMARKDFRAMRFDGSTSQAIVINYNPPGCLQILDPTRDATRTDLPEFARRALALSRPELIQPAESAARPPAEIFGAEPKRKWCYYYEQAELARQQGSWEAILRLKNQSIGAGYFAKDPNEYLPFVEAMLRKHAWDDARQLSKRAYDLSASSGLVYCALWQRAEAWANPGSDYPAALQAAQIELHCTDRNH